MIGQYGYQLIERLLRGTFAMASYQDKMFAALRTAARRHMDEQFRNGIPAERPSDAEIMSQEWWQLASQMQPGLPPCTYPEFLIALTIVDQILEWRRSGNCPPEREL